MDTKSERRIKEVCKYCGGDKLKMQKNDTIVIICQVCGKDFEACRESDFHKFHKVADAWVS